MHSSNDSTQTYEPKIIAFLCNWCSYAGADSAGKSKIEYPPNVHVIRVMCSCRVDPTFVLRALKAGADGVLICGCHPGDCHYITGNLKAYARMILLRKMLQGMGVDAERVRIEWVSASEGPRYAKVVTEMVSRIRALGPYQPTRQKDLIRDQMIKKSVMVLLCECGPIIKEAMDLQAVADSAGTLPQVERVLRYPTLCSEEGKSWLENLLKEYPGRHFVFAACSPREHEKTFQDVFRKAGVNPYLLTVANIREQCGWVHADPQAATAKAKAYVQAAVFRACALRSLEEQEIGCHTDVLVIGSGVAGMNAALLLANADRHVFLVERAPVIGGKVPTYSDVFPNMECASCMLEPLMDEVLHHPNIEVFTYSEVEDILGYFGNFKVKIRKRARHVDPANCYGCRSCHEACPKTVPNREFDYGLASRKAIYIAYLGALPNASVLDESSCLAFHGQECRACVEACPFGNIHLEERDQILERDVGAIIVATGAEDPKGDGDGENPVRLCLRTAHQFQRADPGGNPAGRRKHSEIHRLHPRSFSPKGNPAP